MVRVPLSNEKQSRRVFEEFCSLMGGPLAVFFDYKKLLMSTFFEQVFFYPVWQIEEHGNATPMGLLINSVPVEEVKNFLAGYVCERYALRVSKEDGRFVLRKDKKTNPDKSLVFAQCFSDFVKSGMSVAKYKGGAYSSIVSVKGKAPLGKGHEAYVDLLDSRLMYDGSFGSGRRR